MVWLWLHPAVVWKPQPLPVEPLIVAVWFGVWEYGTTGPDIETLHGMVTLEVIGPYVPTPKVTVPPPVEAQLDSAEEIVLCEAPDESVVQAALERAQNRRTTTAGSKSERGLIGSFLPLRRSSLRREWAQSSLQAPFGWWDRWKRLG